MIRASSEPDVSRAALRPLIRVDTANTKSRPSPSLTHLNTPRW